MKIFIAYASAGAGHQKAAEALYRCFCSERKQDEIRLIDLLEDSDSLFRFCYTFGYSFLVRQAIFIWAWLFRITERGPLAGLGRMFSRWANRAHTKPFQELLIKENPDVVICTHFVPAELASHLKEKGKITSLLVTVITDFGVHPFWLSKATDIYIGAAEFTRQRLISLGVEEKKIRVCGIPIDEKFTKAFDKRSLRRKFALDETRFTVLVMTGSFGIGPIEEIVLALRQEAQLLVVCANNKRLFDKLSAQSFPGVKAFGFVDNTEELMAASDVIVTKPGGLSTSEILAMELAPVFISAIPGQEHENVEALQSHGIVAKEFRKVEDIRKAVLELKNDPGLLKNLRQKIKSVKRPMASQEICRVVCESGGRASG